MVFRNRLIWSFVFMAVLVMELAGIGAAMGEPSVCPTAACAYLPLVSNPPPVRVFESQIYGSRQGDSQMVGDVITTSNRAVYDVQLEFGLYDRSSEPVASAAGETVLEATVPGQLNPFHIVTNFDWTVWTDQVWRYEVAVTGWSLESDREYRPVTTTITRTEELPFQGTWVDVEVRNDETMPLAEVYGTAWSIEQADPSSKRLLSTCLAPGETAAFSEFLWGVQGIEVYSIQAAAQGVVEPCDP